MVFRVGVFTRMVTDNILEALSQVRIQRVRRASEKLRRMSVRGVLYRFCAVSPLILVCTIAAQSRFFVDPFQPLSCTAGQEQDITAYIGPVKAASQLELIKGDRDTIRRVADMWVRGAEKGVLRPLEPISADDSMESPIKSQIAAANRLIQSRLTSIARREYQAGKYEQATSDDLLALQVGDVIKFSDAFSLAGGSAADRSILAHLTQVASHLSDSKKADLREELALFMRRQQSIKPIVRLAQWNIERETQREIVNELARQSPDNANGVGVTRDAVPVAALYNTVKEKKRLIVSGYSHQILFELRSAYMAQQKFQNDADKLIASLPKPAPTVLKA